MVLDGPGMQLVLLLSVTTVSDSSGRITLSGSSRRALIDTAGMGQGPRQVDACPGSAGRRCSASWLVYEQVAISVGSLRTTVGSVTVTSSSVNSAVKPPGTSRPGQSVGSGDRTLSKGLETGAVNCGVRGVHLGSLKSDRF